jgi:hypothetical protein
VSADHQFGAALRSLAATMSELSLPWMVIGGVAVIAAGVPRETIDVDAAVLGRASDLDTLIAALGRNGIVPRIDNARQFARERQVLLLRHDESGVTMEISFAWLPFEEQALARAHKLDVDGLLVPIAQPEDLVVYKVTAWRDRDRADVERLLILHLKSIDIERVRALIVDIAQVLDDPDRVKAFDALVARARKAHADA